MRKIKRKLFAINRVLRGKSVIYRVDLRRENNDVVLRADGALVLIETTIPGINVADGVVTINDANIVFPLR